MKANDVAVVDPQDPLRCETLLEPEITAGVNDGAKKPEGYVRDIVLPGGRVVVRVNDRVSGTETLPAMRSDEAISNDSDTMRAETEPYVQLSSDDPPVTLE